MVGHRIPYIRRRDGKVIGWAVCTKAPDKPQDPRVSNMGWPDPVGIWTYIEEN